MLCSAPSLRFEVKEIKEGFVRLKGWSPQIARFYTAGLFILYCVILLSHKAVPSLTDYSDWTYEGVLLRDHILGIPDPFHTLKVYPVPNSLTTVGIALLALLFSWQIATKLWLCVLLLLSFASASWMIRSLRNEALSWIVIPSSLFLNVNLWYGFINFQFGLCWLLFIACFLLRDARREWILGILLILCFFSHMIPFIFACLLVFFYALQSRRIRLIWQLVPGTLLSLWYVVGRFYLANDADGKAGMVSTVQTYSAAFWAYKVNSYIKSFGFINPVDSHGSLSLHLLGTTGFVILHLANLALCGLIAYGLVMAAILAFRHKERGRFIWLGSSVFIALYLIVPGTTLGISDPGSRLLQTAIAVTLFFGVSEKALPRISRRVVGLCAIVLQAGAIILFCRTVFTPDLNGTMTTRLPPRVVLFAHIPIHVEDAFLESLDKGDKDLRIFPTALFLNKPNAKSPIAPLSPSGNPPPSPEN